MITLRRVLRLARHAFKTIRTHDQTSTDPKPILADCRDLSQLTPGYDAAAFCFALSYFDQDDAYQVLQQLHAVLKPGALLLLSTVAGDAANSGVQTNAAGDSVVSFFRAESEIQHMVARAGFELLFSQRIASPANASQISDDVVLLAKAR